MSASLALHCTMYFLIHLEGDYLLPKNDERLKFHSEVGKLDAEGGFAGLSKKIICLNNLMEMLHLKNSRVINFIPG